MKRNKITIITFFLLSAIFPMHIAAQWKVGATAGYDYNLYSIDTQYAYDLNFSNRSGATVGILGEYGFKDWFGLRAELVYLQKGYKMDRLYNETSQNRRDHYLELPIMARFSFGSQKIRGFLHAGGYVGYWMNSRVKGVERSLTYNPDKQIDDEEANELYAYDKPYDFDSRRDNRFDAGLVGGIGVSYRVLPQLEVEIEGRCYYGLTSTTKDYMKYMKQPRYNTTVAILAGVKYCF